MGIPCNQFLAQEPGTPEEIRAFCSTSYAVDFPLLSKQEVNGDARSPLYQWLVNSGAGGGADISWNFEKFVVNREGQVCGRFAPKTAPDDPDLMALINSCLE